MQNPKSIKGIYRFNEESKTLFKFIRSERAILWKTKELSLPEYVVNEMISNVGAEYFAFVDKEKCVRYTIDIATLMKNAKLKTEGQEPQYYIGLEHFKKKEYTEALDRIPEEVIVQDVNIEDKVL